MTKQLYLVNPQNSSGLKGFPASLLSLDLWVREHCKDIESTIIDASQSNNLKTLSKLTESSERPYVGITATTATYQNALATAREVKRIRPKAITILGGHHVLGQENIILTNHPEIDLTVTGEGEKALESILKGDLTAKGISSREKICTSSGERLTSEELNQLQFQKFNKDYAFNSTQFEEPNLVTARGCPMYCSFCTAGKQGIIAQNPRTVVSQIYYIVDGLKKAKKPTMVAIQDNFFAQNPKRAREIAAELIAYREKTKDDFNWNMQTRVEQFTDSSLVSLLKEAGCSAAYFGIENFDPKMLRTLNKAGDIEKYTEQTRVAIQNCLQYGINPYLNMQFGILGEDQDTNIINEQVLGLIGQNAKRYSISPVVFPSLSVVYPDTNFHRGLMNEGAPENIYELFTKWESENPEYRSALKRYFAHGNGGIPRGIMYMGSLREGKVEINYKELDKIKRYIDKLKKIDGIQVYEYK